MGVSVSRVLAANAEERRAKDYLEAAGYTRLQAVTLVRLFPLRQDLKDPITPFSFSPTADAELLFTQVNPEFEDGRILINHP